MSRGFLGALETIEQGGLGEWEESAKGRLALILLCDQLTRNVFRGTARMYGLDPRALSLSKGAVHGPHFGELRTIERVFALMPLEHSESLADQEECLARFTELAEGTSEPELRKSMDQYVDYAVRHRDIVARFGRFPHRNKILNRESTPEEVAFLSEPGSSF